MIEFFTNQFPPGSVNIAFNAAGQKVMESMQKQHEAPTEVSPGVTVHKENLPGFRFLNPTLNAEFEIVKDKGIQVLGDKTAARGNEYDTATSFIQSRERRCARCVSVGIYAEKNGYEQKIVPPWCEPVKLLLSSRVWWDKQKRETTFAGLKAEGARNGY